MEVNNRHIKCNKTKFATESFANQHIEKIRRKPIPTSSYFCNECKCWHLTKGRRSKEVIHVENIKIKELKNKILNQVDVIRKLELRISELNKKITNYNILFKDKYS